MSFVFLFVLALYFSLLALEMKDGASLGMVERGRPIKCAQHKQARYQARNGLQAQPPSDRAVENKCKNSTKTYTNRPTCLGQISK